MGPAISKTERVYCKSKWVLWCFQFRHSSLARRQTMMQKVIMDEVASDPDAVSPEPGAWPMFIRYPEEEIDLSNIWSMFGITSGGGDIEQSGVSFQAWDISCELDRLRHDFEKRTATISSTTPQYSMMDTEYRNARLHAILDPCIQRTTRLLRSQGHSGELRLRPGYQKGHQIRFRNQERYVVADTTHTLGFVDSCGNVREYLVIMVDDSPQGLEHDLLRAYIAIVNQQRKKRGESNSVVYGLYTNTEFFTFYKIDSVSKVSTLFSQRITGWSYPYGKCNHPDALAALPDWRRSFYNHGYWHSATTSWRVHISFIENVITLCENILDDGVKDCYGVSVV